VTAPGGTPGTNRSPLGLIAGNGQFPFLVADAAKRQGRRVVAVAIREETFPDLEGRVDAMHWVSLGQLGRCIEALKGEGVTEAVMAGQVKHKQIFSGVVPDLKMMALLARLVVKNTDSLIGAVADVLAREGIRLLPSTALLEEHMATAGAMTRRKPSRDERQDIDYGRRVARTLAGMDLGQTVVIKHRAAVALEAMEGTDEVIRRAGKLAGAGTVVVKVAKPRQDMRFDVPVVGAGTVEVMRESGARVLALEAARTLLLDKGRFVAAAEAADIAVWGMEPEP
jgi:UDP-2,3-diacylglucosamine hydrolase